MKNPSQQLADNLARVRDRVAHAAALSNRNPAEIQRVGISKYVDAETTAELFALGCETLGESRPQQLWEKAAHPNLSKARWHMVGHLQRNKVQRTLPLVDLIHSVDSQRVLKAINDAARQLQRNAKILLEINCSGDSEKHGFSSEELDQIVSQLPSYEFVTVKGLMTMAARSGGESVAAKNFAALRELRDRTVCPPDVELAELSMGMSNDFEAAIREGATIVRVGSLLFHGIT